MKNVVFSGIRNSSVCVSERVTFGLIVLDSSGGQLKNQKKKKPNTTFKKTSILFQSVCHFDFIFRLLMSWLSLKYSTKPSLSSIYVQARLQLVNALAFSPTS